MPTHGSAFLVLPLFENNWRTMKDFTGGIRCRHLSGLPSESCNSCHSVGYFSSVPCRPSVCSSVISIMTAECPHFSPTAVSHFWGALQFRRISPCDAPCYLRPISEGSAFGVQYFRGHMGLLALRPGDSLTILLDGFVNRLQDSQFPSFLPFKLRGLDSYPGGTLTHWSCQPSLDARLSEQMSDSISGRGQ